MASLRFRTDEIKLLSKSAKSNVGENKNTPKQAGNKNRAIKPSEQFN